MGIKKTNTNNVILGCRIDPIRSLNAELMTTMSNSGTP